MERQRRLTRRIGRVLAPLAVLVLLLAALYLAADAEGLGAGYAAYYPYVFVAAAVAVALIVAAIARRLLRLRAQLREAVPGARLARRLVLLLMLLALPPVLLVYGFGARFVSATVDSWFRVHDERVLADALEIGRLYLDERLAVAQRATEQVAATLARSPVDDRAAQLDAELDLTGADQLALFARDGRPLALAAATPGALDAAPPEDAARLAALARGRFAEPEPESAAGGMRLRVLVPVQLRAGETALLQGLYALPPTYVPLAQSVETGVHAFGQAQFLRESLKLSLVLVLTFVLMLSVLLAVLVAFDLARRLTAPIGRLAAATRAVAAGRYDRPVAGEGTDELGFLVASFNRMQRELGTATAREREAAAETERQRGYLETVLARLNSGVIGVDHEGHVRTSNPAAAQILGVPLQAHLGSTLQQLQRELPAVAPLFALLGRRAAAGAREWREEIALTLGDQRRLLILRGAALPQGGFVVVFDDTTDLDRARRDAAWGEVARRLAHEVKNPLTPIQLAAERVRRKLLPRMDADDAPVLDRATDTIIAQVETLKKLVDAFTDYAQPPPLKLERTDLCALASEVLELYEQDGRLAITRALSPLPALEADAHRLRQVLHNLLKNATEATVGHARPWVEVATCHLPDANAVELSVADNGGGLPAGFDADWFEPYRTTKTRGTGLGLAICRKIAEEHGGRLLAENRPEGGARFVLRLPLDGR
ncbi:MAG TPA: ATP-binding protein [Xanthomonadaceae bacterium]|nr:ATP-binding protein [Xanthomonadaceae bacterium]